jgi:hypothetical protein
MRKLAIALLFFALGGCVSVTPQQRTAVYNPSELVPYSKTGSAKIVGQAFLKTVGGDVKYGAGDTVWLHPVTSLTNEWFTKHIVQGVPLAAGNPHSDDFRRQAIADAEGRFEFDGLPPGDYYLTCSITWGVPSDIGTMPTGGIAYAKVSVRNGETTKAIVTR